MGKTKKEHFIPRAAFLRKFSDTRFQDDRKNKLLAYSKAENRVIQTNVYDSAAVNSIYENAIFEDNQIENIDNVFDNAPFNNTIEMLDLSYNSLKSIKVLKDKKKYSNLKELKIEGNSNLNYSDKEIQELFDNYEIKYAFNPIL